VSGEIEERVAFAIFRTFIRNGIGSCMVRNANGRQVPETPEEAAVRRWRRLSQKARDGFLAEARAAIQELVDAK
jgi:hypothetical protein